MRADPPTWRDRVRQVGPGLVFVFTVMGPSDLVSNTAAGAVHGPALLWVLAVAVFFRFVWLNLSARFVLASGDTLIAGLARYGRLPLVTALAAMLVFRLVSNAAKVLLAGNALQILAPTSLGAAAWSLAFVAAGYAVITAGGYGVIERVCKVAIAVLGVTLAAAAVTSAPPLPAIARGLVPSLPESRGLYDTALLVTALIGTEAGSLTNVSYTYFIWRKGWRDMSAAPRQRMDLLSSVGALLLVGALLQVTASGAFRGATDLRTVDDLGRLFSSRFGETGLLVFSAGLLAQVFLGFVGGTTGYALAGADIARLLRVGSSKAAPDAPSTARQSFVYHGLVLFWVVSPLYAIVTTWKPVTLALASSLVMASFIPLLAVGLLALTNDRTRMGPHAARPVENVAIVLLALVSLALLARTVWNLGAG
ncbi:MAG: Nramp family divalent metal transporter [Vicinamibacterales bacterium]